MIRMTTPRLEMHFGLAFLLFQVTPRNESMDTSKSQTFFSGGEAGYVRSPGMMDAKPE